MGVELRNHIGLKVIVSVPELEKSGTVGDVQAQTVLINPGVVIVAAEAIFNPVVVLLKDSNFA